MSRIMALGRARHFLVTTEVTACGMFFPEYKTRDLYKVDCLRCRKTKAFKAERQALLDQERYPTVD